MNNHRFIPKVHVNADTLVSGLQAVRLLQCIKTNTCQIVEPNQVRFHTRVATLTLHPNQIQRVLSSLSLSFSNVSHFFTSFRPFSQSNQPSLSAATKNFESFVSFDVKIDHDKVLSEAPKQFSQNFVHFATFRNPTITQSHTNAIKNFRTFAQQKKLISLQSKSAQTHTFSGLKRMFFLRLSAAGAAKVYRHSKTRCV